MTLSSRILPLAAAALMLGVGTAAARGEENPPKVHALFGLAQPREGPFPANWYTVDDTSNLTGLRVSLPLPDCSVRPSDCEDVGVLNSLDGFNLQPRISIPFDGEIDTETAKSDNLYLVDIDRGEKVGINQLVWDLTRSRFTSSLMSFCVSTPGTPSS